MPTVATIDAEPDAAFERRIKSLPKEARDRVLNLRDRLEEHHTLVQAAFEKRQSRKAQLQYVTDQIAQYEFDRDHRSYRGNDDTTRQPGTRTDAERVAAALAGLKEDHGTKEEAYQRACEKYDALVAEGKLLGSLVGGVRKYLASVPDGARFQISSFKATEPKKSESLLNALERTRSSITTRESMLRELDKVLPPLDELKRQLREQIEALAAQGRPQVLVSYDKVLLKFGATPYANFVKDGNILNVPDGPALVAFLHKDALIAAAYAELESTVDAALTMSADEKSQKRVALEEELLALQFEEEALVRRSEDAGQPIARRKGADARAVLWIEPVAAARRAA